MVVDFVGRRSALFWLAFKAGLWTILTLGFYRFWMKTRLRRWYWSSIRPGGHPLEYVGDPWEKLLGFFIAVVILTFYIGIVNLILMFVSFSYFNSSWVGYLASFTGVVPLWFYAIYRARRYVLGRTRWRGVRFGLEKGAWGFAWRALVHWAITICTAGILWPRMTFWLEKYRADRTFFGSAKLHQGGRWWMLYRAAAPMIAVVLATAGYAVWMIWLDPLTDDVPGLIGEFFKKGGIAFSGMGKVSAVWRVWLAPLLLLGLIYSAIHYRFVAKRIMANHKTADGIAFQSALKGPRVSMIYVLGTFIAYSFLVVGIIAVLGVAAATLGPQVFIEAQIGGDNPFAGLPRVLSVVILGVLYLSVFLMWGVLHNAFVTYPLMRHMAVTTALVQVAGLAQVSQRARDEFAEAEGFAEALDLGAAI